MQRWVEDVIQRAYDTGRESAEGLGEAEMKDVLLSVKGTSFNKENGNLPAFAL